MGGVLPGVQLLAVKGGCTAAPLAVFRDDVGVAEDFRGRGHLGRAVLGWSARARPSRLLVLGGTRQVLLEGGCLRCTSRRASPSSQALPLVFRGGPRVTPPFFTADSHVLIRV